MAVAGFKSSNSEFRELGRFIVANPQVCGGKPTFKGTRVMVWQVLEQVAEGMPWEQITWSWRGKVTAEAIAEAVRLASGHFVLAPLSYGVPALAGGEVPWKEGLENGRISE